MNIYQLEIFLIEKYTTCMAVFNIVLFTFNHFESIIKRPLATNYLIFKSGLSKMELRWTPFVDVL